MPFLIAGLGNPGARYAETRHNAGFWFLDRLAGTAGAVFRSQSRLHAETARATIGGADCLLLRPTTFMNHSGQSLRAVMDYFRIDPARILVAYDELDLPPGVARLKRGGGHGGHNGLRDIFRHLADHDFLRLRIGIGHPGHRDDVVGYVLKPAARDDRAAIEAAIEAALDVLPDVVAGNIEAAMKQLHTAT